MSRRRHYAHLLALAFSVVVLVVPSMSTPQTPSNPAPGPSPTKKSAQAGKTTEVVKPAMLQFPQGTATPSAFCGACHKAIHREYAEGFGADLQYGEVLYESHAYTAAGQLLTEMLGVIGLRRQDVFITNVVRCRPPGNRDPLSDELSACDTYTQRQIATLEPKLIVTLGRFSMARFFGPGPMRELHGRSRDWNGITCLAMYHPAAILRTPTVEMRRMYAEDFQKIPVLLQEARNRRAAVAAAPAAPERKTQVNQLPLF